MSHLQKEIITPLLPDFMLHFTNTLLINDVSYVIGGLLVEYPLEKYF